jgi:hypothetical protein
MEPDDVKEFISWLLQRENPSLSLQDANQAAETFIRSARNLEVVVENSDGRKCIYRGNEPFVRPRFLACY